MTEKITEKLHLKTLGDVCDFENGDRGINYPSKSHRTEAGIPFINAGHLMSKKLDVKNMDFISRDSYEAMGAGKIRKGDILFCLRGSLGKFAIVSEYSEGAIASSLIIIRPKQLINSAYLLAYFDSKICLRMIENYSNGAAQPNLSANSLKNFQIPLPPLPEQIAIANLLSKAEALIAKRKESLALLDAYLKSTFLELFGDPVRNEKGWEVKRFYEIVAPDCPLTYGIVQPGEEFKDGVVIVRPVDLTSDIIHSQGLKRIDPKIEKKYRRTRLKGGELLMCVRGTTGVVSIAGEDLKDANVTRGITPIWFTDNFNNLFALSQIKSQSMQKKIQEKTYGIALKQINLRDVRIIEFITPPLKLQNQFAAVVEKVEALKEKYQTSLGELENLYGSLSQRAFRGELGVG